MIMWVIFVIKPFFFPKLVFLLIMVAILIYFAFRIFMPSETESVGCVTFIFFSISPPLFLSILTEMQDLYIRKSFE